jgi:hypothetical protein
VSNSVQAQEPLRIETFGAVLPNLMIEAILDQSHPNQLRLHTWNGRKSATVPTATYRGCTYTPALIAGGLARAVRFSTHSKSFGSAANLTSSMLDFLIRYAHLSTDAAPLLVAFALASWFPDCGPVAAVLHLLGPDNEARQVLRLLACICRRPVLLSDIDVPALATLPSQLDPTLLIGQHNLPRSVMRVLVASNNRHFSVARGNGQLHFYGAKAFSADPETVPGAGVRISLSPAQNPLPTLTDANEREIANDFRAKLLRYRMVNHRRVCDAQIDTRDFVPAMRDEVRTWLAPIRDCPDFLKSVSSCLLQQSQEAEGDRLSDNRCLVAEAALFFCHKANTQHFFVGELAECVNTLLNGRHEDRVLTDKMAGLLLRALGIHGQRVVKGYRILLTDTVRERIHRIADAYQVVSVQDGVARCGHCRVGKAYGGTY